MTTKRKNLVNELWQVSCDYELQDNDIYNYNDFVEYCKSETLETLQEYLQEIKNDW